jgi:hypothetical protein
MTSRARRPGCRVPGVTINRGGQDGDGDGSLAHAQQKRSASCSARNAGCRLARSTCVLSRWRVSFLRSVLGGAAPRAAPGFVSDSQTSATARPTLDCCSASDCGSSERPGGHCRSGRKGAASAARCRGRCDTPRFRRSEHVARHRPGYHNAWRSGIVAAAGELSAPLGHERQQAPAVSQSPGKGEDGQPRARAPACRPTRASRSG